LRASWGLAALFQLSSRPRERRNKTIGDTVAAIVVQGPKSSKGILETDTHQAVAFNIWRFSPMIARKNMTGGMEFLMTVGISAAAGLLAFLLVSIVAHLLGLTTG